MLEPDALEIVARCELPEPSIARLSADGDDVYVVGDATLFRVAVGRRARSRSTTASAALPHARRPDLRLGRGARARRGVVPRQRRGQRALRGHVPRPGHLGGAAAPRARRPRDRRGARSPRSAGSRTGSSRTRRSSTRRGASSSATTAATACSPRSTSPTDGTHVAALARASRTTRAIRCCSPTPASSSPTTTTATAWPTQIVVLDIETGDERVRVDAGSPVQSVVFPAPGFDRDLYYCSFPCVSRIRVVP